MIVDYKYNEYDFEVAKIISDFLPDKLFDAHMHISHNENLYKGLANFESYYEDMRPFVKDRLLRANAILYPEISLKDAAQMHKSLEFTKKQLEAFPNNVAEIEVLPSDTVEDIEKRLVHPNIKGLKCYHIFANRSDTFNADIEEYLPESAWEVASKRRLAITLHMVKDNVLADESNLKYIINMAKKYPDATLILAHAARAFAAWTVFDTVDKLKDLDNVWFDFSGVCESPAIQYILKKIGTTRCMWGTDFPVSSLAGKCISIADSFYWINADDINSFKSKTQFKAWHVISEEFMALRQAFILADITPSQIEDVFYNNAEKLFG